MPTPNLSPKTSGERGNIVVELSLALPLLLFMVAGALDLGSLFWEKHVLTNATRGGARVAVKALNNGTNVVPEKTQAQVKQVVQTYLNRFRIKALDGSNLVLDSNKFSYTWTTKGSETMVSVKLQQIPYQMMLLPNFRTFFGYNRQSGDDAFYLQAGTTMAAEWITPPSP